MHKHLVGLASRSEPQGGATAPLGFAADLFCIQLPCLHLNICILPGHCFRPQYSGYVGEIPDVWQSYCIGSSHQIQKEETQVNITVSNNLILK